MYSFSLKFHVFNLETFKMHKLWHVQPPEVTFCIFIVLGAQWKSLMKFTQQVYDKSMKLHMAIWSALNQMLLVEWIIQSRCDVV